MPASVSIPGGDVEVAGILESKHFLVNATINGQGPYKFVVDTGAAIATVSSNLGSQLPSTPVVVNASGTGGTVVNLPTVRIDALGIGSMKFEQFLALVHDIPAVQQHGADGIIGLPIFNDVTMRIDYPRRTLRVQTSRLGSHDCNRPINGAEPIATGYSLAYVDLTVAGHTVSALIDSGSKQFLELPNSYASLPFTGPLSPGTIGGVAGTDNVLFGTLDGNASVACATYEKPTIVLTESNSATLGADGWQRHILFIDARSKLMRLQDPDCPANNACIVPTVCPDMSGNWLSGIGNMLLTQSGNIVEGIVSDANGILDTRGCPATITGTLSAGSADSPDCPGCLTWSGTWSTLDPNKQYCTETGQFAFEVTSDLYYFSGQYTYDNYPEFDPAEWDGVRGTCGDGSDPGPRL